MKSSLAMILSITFVACATPTTVAPPESPTAESVLASREMRTMTTPSGKTYRYAPTGDAGIQAETREARRATFSAAREEDARVLRAQPAVSPSDVFEVDKHVRGVAKTTYAHAKLTVFASLDALLDALPTDADMSDYDPPIDHDTLRVREEIKNVGVCAFIVGTAKQSDADYHLILSNGKKRYMNAEVSGIPDRGPVKDRQRVIAVRQAFESFVEESGRSAGDYKGWGDPIPVWIEGSLFWDSEHVKTKVGPGWAKPKTVWEIHPISKIEFEPARCTN